MLSFSQFHAAGDVASARVSRLETPSVNVFRLSLEPLQIAPVIRAQLGGGISEILLG